MTDNHTADSDGAGTPKAGGPQHLPGHLGNLTPEQEASLAVFRGNLAEAGLYTPPSGDSKASHDDATLLRFLRARGFNLPGAQKQFADCEEWRGKHDVDKIYKDISAEDLDQSRRFYPRWTGRRDKLGIPVYVYRLAALDAVQHQIDKITPEGRFNRIVALNEYMIRFTLPLCSNLPRSIAPTPISSTMSIVDLDQVAFTSMWRLRHFLGEASRLTTANYPETVHMIAIVNAPSFFPTIWGWLKSWFDEGTQRKIHVLGRDPGNTLRELIHACDLPVPYGGELGWKYEDEPCLDEDIQKAIGTFPKGPSVFVDGTVKRLEEE